jgi:flagellin-like hook-associated protein FlgL
MTFRATFMAEGAVYSTHAKEEIVKAPAIHGAPIAVLCLCAGLVALPPAASAQGSSSLMFLNRVLGEEGGEAGKSIERLAGGRGLLPDNPANYAIYELLEGQVRGLGAVIRNRADMLSLYRFEDSLLGTLSDAIQRIRELVVEESNGTLDSSDRDIIEAEIDELYDQVLEALAEAEFNKVKVFASIAEAEPVKAALRSRAHYSLESVDALLDFLIRERSLVGAKSSGSEYAIAGEEIEKEGATGFISQGDTDIGAEVSSLRREDLLMLADLLMLGGK